MFIGAWLPGGGNSGKIRRHNRISPLAPAILRLSPFVCPFLFQPNVTRREKLHQRENLRPVNRTHSTRDSERLSEPGRWIRINLRADRLIVLVCDLHFVFGNATGELVSCIRERDTNSRCFHWFIFFPPFFPLFQTNPPFLCKYQTHFSSEPIGDHATHGRGNGNDEPHRLVRYRRFPVTFIG